MAHADTALNERLAVPAELVELRALGLRPAPRRYLATMPAPATRTFDYPAWPILTIVTLQVAGLITVAVIR
jgi:hypothetical protein